MNLDQLLFLTSLNRDTYNTLVKRGQVPFMDRDLTSTKRDRYNEVHALALTLFVRLRAQGVSATAAGTAVNDSFRHLAGFASGNAGTSSDRCGIRHNHLGLIDTYGHPRKDTDPSRLIGESWVSITQAWSDLQRSFRELAANRNGDAQDDQQP